MNNKAMMLKQAISELCTLRCEQMRLIYEGAEFEDKEAKEKEVEKQEIFLDVLIKNFTE